MIEGLKLIVAVLASLFMSRAELEAEMLVLRQQVNVLRRRMPKRPPSWACCRSTKLPDTREAYDTATPSRAQRASASTGPAICLNSIVDGWQQIRKDFAYWRALTNGIETSMHQC